MILLGHRRNFLALDVYFSSLKDQTTIQQKAYDEQSYLSEQQSAINPWPAIYLVILKMQNILSTILTNILWWKNK